MKKQNSNVINKIIDSSKISKELQLDQLIMLLTAEYGEQEAKPLILDFCLYALSEDITKYGMEYFYVNGHHDELQVLIDKNSESEKTSNRTWAEVYQLSKDRYFKRNTSEALCSQDILTKANSIKTDEPALICVIEFLKVGVYNQLGEFEQIGNFLDKQPELFDQIEDQYLRKSFQKRLYENLFLYHWVRNELIVARKYAFQVLNRTSNVNALASMHINLGLTYTFDTYHQGMYHFNEALNVAKQHNLHDYIHSVNTHNIPFLSAHFKQVEGITTTDKSELAHIEIAKGNLDEAKKILKQIEINSPFRQYYLGLATRDRSILLQSYRHFIERRSDYFFSRLPLNAIKKM